MSPWGVSRDGNKPLPLGHRFSIFRFLPSPSSLMVINPHSSFSQWSIAYSLGPHLKAPYLPLSTTRFPIRVVPHFSRDSCRIRFPPCTSVSVSFPQRNLFLTSRRPSHTRMFLHLIPKTKEGRVVPRKGSSAGYASALHPSAQCFPAFVLPRGIIILRVFPKQFIDQRTHIYIAYHSFDLREGMVLPFQPQHEFPPQQRWNRNSII